MFEAAGLAATSAVGAAASAVCTAAGEEAYNYGKILSISIT